MRFFFPIATLLLLISCKAGKEPLDDPPLLETHEVADSVGYAVGNGVAYATIRIDEPVYLSEICRKNFAIWLSTVLEMEKSSDKDAVHSLASVFTRQTAAQLQKTFALNQEEFSQFLIDRVYTTVDIRKIWEDDTFVTYLLTEETFTGGAHASHTLVGYTFLKADLSLADLIKPGQAAAFRRAITKALPAAMGVKADELMEMLFVEDDCKKEEMVPLPANGAYLTNDTLVFRYQEYEIAPYAYGMPCVKLPYDAAE